MCEDIFEIQFGGGGDGGIINFRKNCLCSMGVILGTLLARWAG